MGKTILKIGHDYLPPWNSPPLTIIQIDEKKGGVQAEFYTGSKRWFSIKYFERHFTHFKDCVQCTKG